MRTRLLGGVAAVIVAIIGTVLLITYVNGADRRAFASTETQDVYVVQKPIAAGTRAESLGDSIVKRPLPKAAIAENAVTDLSSLKGKAVSADLEPGEELLASRFVEPAALQTPGRVDVPAGLQEVTVRLPIERVVGGTLSAGDTVGVFLSLPKDNRHPDQTQLSYHKVLVTGVQLATGAAAPNNADAPAPDTEKKGSGALGGSKSTTANTGEYLVTLARTAADAERIVFTSEFGKVYLSKEPAGAKENNGGVLDRTKVFR